MRRLVGALLALVLVMSGVPGVGAQEAKSSFGDGVGSTVVWTDERGNEIATLEVDEVVAGWDEYDDRSAPDRGYDYYAVHFTVTNVGDDDIEINSQRFSLVDTLGLSNSLTNVNAARESTANIISGRFEIGPGASEEAMLVFQLFGDVSPEVFVWQPANGFLVMVDVGDGGQQESAVSYGFNTPATFADDRGNPIGSMEVTEIEDDWQDFAESQDPDRGHRYVAVHVSVTNLSDSPFELNPSHFSLLDHESADNRRSNVRVDDDAAVQPMSNRFDVAPGETYEGMMVYVLYEGVAPTAMLWQSTSDTLTVVVLDEADADADIDAGATPVGSPAAP